MSVPSHGECDRTWATAQPSNAESAANGRPPHARWVLATCILASSLAFIDGAVVNVGLPAIGRDLDAGGDALAWVLNGYLLPLSALLLMGGAAGDLYGRRRLLVIGTLLFAVASLMCAWAPNLQGLVAGRVSQGVGAALLLPNSLAILGASFGGEERGRAIGVWAAVGAGAGAAGPVLGGWLIDLLGWRSMFFINLPITAATIVLALRYLPGAPATAHGRPPLDLAGGLFASLALGALTWSLTTFSASRQADASVWIGLLGGLVALLLFLAIEHRKGNAAMLPLALFGAPEFVGLSLLTLLLYGALGGLMVLIPYALIEAHGYSAVAAGAALLPLPLLLAATSPTMGRLAVRLGPRLPLTVGPMIVALGCLLARRVVGDGATAAGTGPATDYWTTAFPALLVIALGLSAAVAPLTTAVLAAAKPEHTGVASGFNSAIARAGGLVASALLGGVLALHGTAVAAPFRTATAIAATAALVAGICAFVWVGRRPVVRNAHEDD